MIRNGSKRGKAQWECVEKSRARDRGRAERKNAQARKRYAEDARFRAAKNEANLEWYYNLSGYAYNLRILKMRRRAGLARMRARNERSASGSL